MRACGGSVKLGTCLSPTSHEPILLVARKRSTTSVDFSFDEMGIGYMIIHYFA
jgi:hypothetical protein